MICDPRGGLSCRMFRMHLRRRCVFLHLNGMSWRYQCDPSGLMCHLRLVFPCWFSVHCYSEVLKSPTIITVNYYILLLLLSISPSCLLLFALCIEVLLCWVHRYLQLLHFPFGLIPWTLHCVHLYLLVIFFILKSTLSEMRIAAPAFFLFPFLWNIFFHSLTLRIYVL